MTYTKAVRDGFSLIELMIVIAIIGLLMAVTGPALMNYLERAKKSNTQSTLRVLKGAMTTYYADIGNYPERLRDLVKVPQDQELANKWGGPYVESKTEPRDGWGNKFRYQRTPGAQNAYELFSRGPAGSKRKISVWDL